MSVSQILVILLRRSWIVLLALLTWYAARLMTYMHAPWTEEWTLRGWSIRWAFIATP